MPETPHARSPVATLPWQWADPVPPLNILFIETQALARHSLGALLPQGPYGLQVVGLAASCAEAEAIWPTPAPDLLLLSWPLLPPEGLPQALNLLPLGPHTTMLVLAEDMGDVQLLDLMTAGVAGCLPKHIDPTALSVILRSLHQGARIWPIPRPPATLLGHLTGHPTAPLTSREHVILQAVGEGLTNNQIAHRLGLSAATVRTHVRRLLTKLSLANRTQLVLHARQASFKR